MGSVISYLVVLVSLIHIMSISASAGSWQGPVQIEKESAAAYLPKIAVDGKGNTFAVWRHYYDNNGGPGGTTSSIWTSFSKVGTGWETPISQAAGNYLQCQDIVSDSHGNAMVMWLEPYISDTQSRFVSRVYRPESGWSGDYSFEIDQPVFIFEPDACPKLVADDMGRAYLTWATSSGVYGNSFTVNRGWEEPKSLSKTAWGVVDAVASANGNAVASWCDGTLASSGLWVIQKVNNKPWEIVMIAGEAGKASLISCDLLFGGPQVSINNNGDALAIWTEGKDYSFRVMTSHSTDGKWSKPEEVDSLATFPTHLDLDMNNNGDAVAVWSDEISFDVRAAGYRQGHGWDTTETIRKTDTHKSFTKAKIDMAGNAVAVWQDGDIWAGRYINGSGWEEAQRISNGENRGFLPQIDMNKDGVAAVIWNQENTGIYDIWSSRFE